jgi:hypothetical protein
MTARKIHIVLILVCVSLPCTASAQVAPSRPSSKLTPLPRDLEIELALSALPPHLRDGATVYVLNPAKGFEVARKGSNEFHALVARTGDDTFRGSWPFTEYRDDILYPIGFDRAGANAQMRVFLDAAELQAKGTPATELKTIIKERYATKHYRSPERAGVAYMLSPVLRTYFDPEHGDQVATVNIPHVMYYAPNVSSADIGAGPIGPGNPYPFIIMPGPHGYSVQLLGAVEGAAVTKQYEEMLARLCRIKDLWCLPAAKER